MWFVLVDGTRERLNEAEVDALCDALWSSDKKGAVSVAGKISHERRRPPMMQERVTVSEGEMHAFRSALDDVRHEHRVHHASGQ